jgi:hypothetical protein
VRLRIRCGLGTSHVACVGAACVALLLCVVCQRQAYVVCCMLLGLRMSRVGASAPTTWSACHCGPVPCQRGPVPYPDDLTWSACHCGQQQTCGGCARLRASCRFAALDKLIAHLVCVVKTDGAQRRRVAKWSTYVEHVQYMKYPFRVLTAVAPTHVDRTSHRTACMA